VQGARDQSLALALAEEAGERAGLGLGQGELDQGGGVEVDDCGSVPSRPACSPARSSPSASLALAPLGAPVYGSISRTLPSSSARSMTPLAIQRSSGLSGSRTGTIWATSRPRLVMSTV
jgi:hypothetical protein